MRRFRLWLARLIAPSEWRIVPSSTPFMDGFDAATTLLVCEMHKEQDPSAFAGSADEKWLNGWNDGIIK